MSKANKRANIVAPTSNEFAVILDALGVYMDMLEGMMDPGDVRFNEDDRRKFAVAMELAKSTEKKLRDAQDMPKLRDKVELRKEDEEEDAFDTDFDEDDYFGDFDDEDDDYDPTDNLH